MEQDLFILLTVRKSNIPSWSHYLNKYLHTTLIRNPKIKT